MLKWLQDPESRLSRLITERKMTFEATRNIRGYFHGQDQSFSTTIPGALSQYDYTVGWICALPLELTAAKAVLDEVHPPPEPSIPSSDSNAYTLGSIHGHNTVIACLPIGVYGTTSAATVASQMLSTFPSITTRLMVGVAGGVPTKKNDIRLGDVVVSTPNPQCPAVVQYDYGKTLADGQFHRTGQLNNPPFSLLTVVSKLKADHGLEGGQLPMNLARVFEKYPLMKEDYAYPGQGQDFLLEPGCDHHHHCHVEAEQPCSTCELSKLVKRSHRSDDSPRIHYGPIASGNQVIKHGKTRDRLAKQLGIFCFEMEAAGLMDSFPCLIIRGICDYSDAGKNKRFQNYAALTAAAYTKELLSRISPKNATSSSVPQQIQDLEEKSKKHRKLAMQSLRFDDAETRRATIKNVHIKTCQWMLQQPDYLDWLNREKFSENHGFLWIKGKPGAGKSVIMKFLHEKTVSEKSVSISYFFNARGMDLEKSTTGMYRSLLYQLLQKLPRLQKLLDTFILPVAGQWGLEVLEDIFRLAIWNLKEHLLCFVDALDECSEEQIRDMVEFFEGLVHLADFNQIHLNVCFSSRHYPRILVHIGLQLILDNQQGHSDDIASYLSSELRIGESKKAKEIKIQIREKASGIFLWVVLVVQILKRAYDKGRIHMLQAHLERLPAGLNELFKDMLMRDGHNFEELTLCIQWTLYARKPLKQEEFYFAILSTYRYSSLWDAEEVTLQDMGRFILDISKGLVEVTQSKEASIVQFIHESVREFLLKECAFTELWPGSKEITQGLSHERLKRCCYNCIEIDHSKLCMLTRWENPPGTGTGPGRENGVGPSIVPIPAGSVRSRGIRHQKRYGDGREIKPRAVPDPSREHSYSENTKESASRKFPFLEYAVTHILDHADAAEGAGVAQSTFIDSFPFDIWVRLNSLFQGPPKRGYVQRASLLYIYADRGLPNLIKAQLRKSPVLDTKGDLDELPLLAAITGRHESAFQALLMLDTDLQSNSEDIDQSITMLFGASNTTRPEQGQSILCYMAMQNKLSVVKLLLDHGAAINAQGEDGKTALYWAATNDHEAMVKQLLERGAEINMQYTYTKTALYWQATFGYRPKIQDIHGPNPLCLAVRNGYEGIVKQLMDDSAV